MHVENVAVLGTSEDDCIECDGGGGTYGERDYSYWGDSQRKVINCLYPSGRTDVDTWMDELFLMIKDKTWGNSM